MPLAHWHCTTAPALNDCHTCRVNPLVITSTVQHVIAVRTVAAIRMMSTQGEGRQSKREREGRARRKKCAHERLPNRRRNLLIVRWLLVLYSDEVSLYTCQCLQASWLGLYVLNRGSERCTAREGRKEVKLVNALALHQVHRIGKGLVCD